MTDRTEQPNHPDNLDIDSEELSDQFFAFHSEADDLEIDEPWSEADLDGDPHTEEPLEPVAFDTDDQPLDFRSRERWIQSCLRRLTNPKLAVDGVPGRGTRRALRKFQKNYRKQYPDGIRLAIDGVIGPDSIKALEQCTESRAPEITEKQYQASLSAGTPGATAAPENSPEPEASPPPTAPDSIASTSDELTVSTKTVNGKKKYYVSGHGEDVSFRYKTRERLGSNSKPITDNYNVSLYRGGKKDLLDDAELMKIGYTNSEIKILKANALKESGGNFGAVNTWDNQIVSWGMAQFAGHAGSLAGLLRSVKEDFPAAFAKHFTSVGIDIDTGPYPYYDRKSGKRVTKNGVHVVIAANGRTYTGDDGWSYLRKQPKLVGALMIAGNDPRIALAQCSYWKRVFLDRAVNTVVGTRRRYSVVRVIGKGRARREQVLLAPTRSRDEWVSWAARPQNHVGGKNLETLFSNHPRARMTIDDPGTTGAKLRVTVEKTGGAPIREFVTSEYGLGLIARLYNWMPAYVRKWSSDFFAVLETKYPGRDIRETDTWDCQESLESEFRELVKDRRREVKKGSYDTYGLDLNQARGSFYIGTPQAQEHAPASFVSFSDVYEVDGEEDDDDDTIILDDELVTPGGGTSDTVDDERPPPPPMIDPATLAPDVDVTDQSPKKKRKKTRNWSKITGITLHQTGIHGFGARAWKKVTAHLGVHSDGRVFHIHPLNAHLWASNGFNRDTVAIEVAGNFLRDENKPNSYWKQGGGPSQLDEKMIDGLRRAIRFIMAEVAAHGGQITHIHAHRQTKKAKAACPGAQIWQHAGVWAQTQLGLSDGGPGYTRGDGQPIPDYWDPRLRDGPVSFFEEEEFFDDDAYTSEIDIEHPDEDELTLWNNDDTTISGGTIQLNRVPGGTKVVAAEHEDDGPTSRGDLDFSGPLDLDDTEPRYGLSDIFEQALAEGGLTFVDQIVIEPDEDAPRSRGDFDEDEALDFEITIEEDEASIVLLEQDGMYRWILPDTGEEDGPTHRAADAPRNHFRIPINDLALASEDEAEEGTGQTRGFITDKLTSGVRALVYKYVLSRAADLAVDVILGRMDGKVREGPVIIPSTEMDDWIDADDLKSLKLPSDRPARVLLLIHGTFSSTRSSFGALATADTSVLTTALNEYDAVFGVDHRTLSRWPAENAKAIADYLEGDRWAHPPQIDVISFSRGGLVARTLIERELPSRGWKGQIVRALFVATTNAGTELARPENWHAFADLLTSLSNITASALSLIPGAGTVAGVVGRELLSGIAGFITELANIGLTNGKIPGLAAMDPSSEVVTKLNQTPLPAPVTAEYYGMNSRFEPGFAAGDSLPAGLKAYLASRAVTKLYRGKASDLVVHNQSTQTLHPELKFTKFHHFESNALIFHTNFFTQKEVRELLRSWLDLPEMIEELSADDVVEIDDFLPDSEDEWDEMDIPLDFSSEPDDIPLIFGDPDDDGDDDGDITLHMQSSAPREVAQHGIFTVHVTLSREEIANAIAGEEGVDATGIVDTENPLEVELIARRGVSLAGYERIQVGVPPKTGNIGVFFRVRADDLGDAQMWVLVHQDGRCALRSVLGVRVVARLALPTTQVVMADDLPAFDPSLAPADPSLEVIEMRSSEGLRFRYQLTSVRLGLNHRFESPRITADAETYFGDLYNRIEKEWKTANQNPRMFQRLLRALGTQLGEQLLPREMRIKLWDLRDKLHGLQILSDETYIPWEILHLKHPDQPLPRGESHFLGQLGLVRSMWETTPASRIIVRPGRALTLVPTYPNRRLALPEAQAEREWFESKFSAGQLPPNSEDVLDAFEQPGDFDLLHIACHGDLADRDAWLILEGTTRKGKWYPDKLSASLVAATADLGKGTEGRPFVFLNACKVARQEKLLSSAVGWAPTLLGAGAGAVVAPMWKVGDSAAQKFSEGFYSALLKGASFARAAMAAREFARAQGDPTWLAYAVYAHPRCTLKLENGT